MLEYTFKNKVRLTKSVICSKYFVHFGDGMWILLYSWAWSFKLMMSLVNVSLKFQMLISEICQYFLLKNMRSFSHFFSKKYLCIWLYSRKTLNKLTS